MSVSEDFSAMTVNERLFACDLMNKFDEAVADQDLAALRRIFARIELPDYDFVQPGLTS